ncbi:MAG: ABC transporter permease subunit [Clostridia bacterium]|nr:ABC transporter permease subunit [Clostridia bacterium]
MLTAARKKGKGSLVCKLVVLAVLIGLVFVPVIKMFSVLTMQDIRDVFTSQRLVPALLNSLSLTAIATVIVIILAYALAWCIERTDIKLKGLFGIILVLPMLIPSISHGMGLIILLGRNGIITNLLGVDSGFIYGKIGIIAGSVMYAFPVAFIMLADVLRYEDRSVYQAADILGIDKKRRFARITLPFLRKPLIAATFSAFAMIVTDYGVPLMIGGTTKTVSLLMYEEVISQLKFGRGCVYGILLLIPAIVAFVTDMLNKDRAGMAFVKRTDSKRVSRARNALAYTVCILVSVLALLPILAFVILAFVKSYPNDMSFTLDNIINTMQMRGGGKYLLNSLLIAFAAATLGTVIGFLTAYLTSRCRSALSKLIHMIVLAFMAIPGIVLGLSYAITFTGMKEVFVIFFALIMVNVAHFVASPYLMMYNTFGKMNENLEPVGETLGIGRIRMLRDIFIPMSFGTVLEMFSYLFVNCMMTISAVSFIANNETYPISLMINKFEAQMQYESVAVVSLSILLVNLALKAVIALIKKNAFNYRQNKKKRYKNELDKKAV